jgi:hypothetical protein
METLHTVDMTIEPAGNAPINALLRLRYLHPQGDAPAHVTFLAVSDKQGAPVLLSPTELDTLAAWIIANPQELPLDAADVVVCAEPPAPKVKPLGRHLYRRKRPPQVVA